MPRQDKVLWLDLETSGNEDDALILEVGMVVTGPGPNFAMRDVFHRTIHPGNGLIVPMHDDVLLMHQQNNLLYELAEGDNQQNVEADMREFIERNFGDSGQHFIIAGSGVSHFDMKYIKRDWPWLAKKAAYYQYDLGSLRRFLRMVDIEAPKTDIPHRALHDVLHQIEEARWLLRKISLGA